MLYDGMSKLTIKVISFTFILSAIKIGILQLYHTYVTINLIILMIAL